MDREIRILHTADTHLGYKQYHSEVRRKDFFAAFEIVVKDAVEMQVDAVVHAGDLFDSRNPTLEDLLETINILSGLKAAGIPFFGIVGNHESKQNTQWLDLLQEMGLAARLGKKPQIVEDVVIYGIDSVPRSKIPLYDYSGFEVPENSTMEYCRKLLVMHQIVQPFPYAEWDCADILKSLPFKVDVILLGDYHKYEKFTEGETWITYSGSTERNSASEEEPRSYNIITLSDDSVEISKRRIPTRDFLTIPVTLNGEEKSYEQIFSAINELFEEIPGSVVFLEVSGDSKTVLSISEIEDYLLKKGALVAKVVDRRRKESIPVEALKVTFTDPDHAVANEIKKISLNDGGIIIDEIVRNPNVPRSRVDEETEDRLSKLIEVIDFKDPDFKVKIPVSPIKIIDPGEVRYNDEDKLPENEDKLDQDIKPALIFELVAGSASASENVSELLSKPVSANTSGLILEPVTEPFSRPAKKINSRKPDISEQKKDPEPLTSIEPEEDHGPEKNIETKTDLEPEKETKIAGEEENRIKKLSPEKQVKVSEMAGKAAKKGQKKGKEKSAVPRQYNLGDYL
ncbi:MAG: repair protein SbcD/Mre11 [Euryarchaeota archaeon]|nr:repair protein SbcD/Mre11 [Euryarchaeota archaeon]